MASKSDLTMQLKYKSSAGGLNFFNLNPFFQSLPNVPESLVVPSIQPSLTSGLCDTVLHDLKCFSRCLVASKNELDFTFVSLIDSYVMGVLVCG